MVLLGTACAAGVVVSSQLPLVGLPVTAAAAAGLAFRGRVAVSVLAAAVGVAAAASVLPVSVAFVAPAAAAILLAVWLLPRRSAQLVALLLTGAIAGGAAAVDILAARSLGQSLMQAVRAQAIIVSEGLKQALGSSASAWTEQLAAARSALVMLWPSFYVQTALFAAVFVIAAIAWAARRSGIVVEVPANRDLDLSVHVLWALVVGLVLLATAPLFGSSAQLARVVGFNALFVARTLFFLQGIAVFSAVFDVPRTGYGKMVALYIVLWVLDQVLLIVSLIGMLDFWANFRRLPRDGSGAPARLEEPPSSI